jgi:integrase
MIDKALVIKALEPIWERAPVTGSRLRGRLEAVLAFATVRDLRVGDNPAAWELLKYAGFAQPAKVEHHTAIEPKAIPDFMARLRKEDDPAARVLELIALTVVRSSEALGASWTEFDLDNRVWIVPSGRMKMKKEHRIPLSAAAVKLLKSLPRDGDQVFPPLRRRVVWALANSLSGGSVYGLRATFKTWTTEHTSFPSEMAEIAVAHKVGNKVEEAYRRGDMFERRRKMMEAWAQFCQQATTGNVVAIGGRS